MVEYAKVGTALALIAIILSGGTLFYVSQLIAPLNSRLDVLNGDLTRIGQDMDSMKSSLEQIGGELKASELFSGERAIYQKALKEGKVIVYTIWDVVDIVALGQGFTRRYPGIAFEYWQARNPEIITRVTQEFQAGQQSVDVIGSDSGPPPLRKIGAILSYETVQKDNLIYHDPTMPVCNLQVQVLTYNTKLLKEADAPKSWEDVANPKFAGKVALDDPLRIGPLTWGLLTMKDEWKDDAKWTAYVKGLKALNVPTFQSTAQLFRLVVAGEYAIAMPSLLNDVANEQKAGAPIAIVKGAPPIVVPRFSAIYAKAPHPNAAILFAEWTLSGEGQAIFASKLRTPSMKNFPSEISLETFTAGQPVVYRLRAEWMTDPASAVNQYIKPLWT